ncbi:sodium:solute symporter family transporter [Cerasicoccus maritimus]|uniref:sodium:solute symporter family transporter n=1 Tax=Cerasicoccus maritimus TaxID=490089 RepID=UPI002852BB36|nr:hypothetical protein [Cerasicoccus maritimus]
MQTSDYVTIGVYLVFLVVIGWFFGRLSRTASDYVRGGGKATWWLVGSSSLLAGISAFTFTGNAAAAFEAGPTLLVIYAANIIAYLIQGFCLAAWFRQTRAYTVADVLRDRFGPSVEQFKAYYGLIFGLLSGAVPLWALAVFCSSAFGFSATSTILILGIVVTVYSIRGGKWAVMGNDFVQSLILFPITILVAWYCLREVGGISGFIDLFSRPDLADDFAFVKPEGAFEDNKFSLKWIVAVFFIQLTGQLNLLAASRYLAAHDGREASRAAFFCAGGMLFGAIVWFIPPMVARGLWEAEVLAMPVGQAGGGSYAVAAMKVLPNGLMGVMIVAMFAATLSTMDTAINANAGIIIRNIVPPFRRLLSMKELDDQSSIWIGRVSTVVLGAANTGLAIWYSLLEGFGLFDSLLILGSVFGLPISIPLLSGLFLKRLPRWSFFFIASVAIAPALWSLVDQAWYGNTWTYVDRSLWVIVFGLAATVFCIPFYSRQPVEFRNQVDAFFQKMNTPLSEEERGEGNDHIQARMLGLTTIVMGCFLLLLMCLPNPLAGRLAILAVGGSVILVGALLLLVARFGARRQAQERVSH